MKSNVGGIDRILRLVVGLALVAAAATGAIGAWGFIGIVPILTGALAGARPTCPSASAPARRRTPDRRGQACLGSAPPVSRLNALAAPRSTMGLYGQGPSAGLDGAETAPQTRAV